MFIDFSGGEFDMEQGQEILKNYSIEVNDHNPNAFCLIKLILDEQGKPVDWIFIYCNDALARLEGKSKKEITGNKFFDLFPDGNRKWLSYYYKSAYEGQFTSFDEISEEIGEYLHIDTCPVGEKGYCTCTLYDVKKEVYDKRKAEETQGMITALTADYLNVYVIEPETNKGTILKLDGYVINGIKETPKNFTYSDVLRTYANDRVCDEDRNYFLEMVLPEPLVSTFADGREKLELKYRVPIDGKLEHYSGLYYRISKPDEPLKLIAGFRNTEDVVSIQEKTRTEGLYSAYEAVSDLYLAMFRVNVKENTYAAIKTTDAVLKYTLPDNNKYDENLKSIITALADEDSLSEALAFLDLNTIEERMKEKTHISVHFNGRVAGSCKLHLISEQTDNLSYVILAVEILENGEYEPVFDVLARNFQNVFLINIENGAAKILKMDGYITSGIDNNDHKIFDYPSVLKKYIQERVHPEDRDMLYEKINMNHLTEVFKNKDEYVGNYRVLVDGVVHHFQYNLSKPKGNKNIVCGFQNVDAIIQDHLEREKEEREKKAAHKKEVDEQIAIVNTLATSFNNVYVANLEDGSARVIRLAENYNVNAIRDVTEVVFPFNAVVERWVKENVHPDDKERIRNTLTIENLKRIFSTQNELVGTYRSIDHGVLHNYQYDFRRIEGTQDVVVGFKIIDDIIEEQRAQQERERKLQEAHLKEVQEHTQVISALSTIYSTIFRANIVTHEYEILGSVPLMAKVAPKIGNFDDVKKTVIENFMEPEFRKPLNEFLDLNTLADRLEKVNTVTVDYKAPTGQWMQARFIAKQRDENGRAIETLYVARDITKEKTRDLEQQHNLEQALEITRRDKEELQKSETMLREAGAISDALSRDYSNVFLVQPKKNLGKTVKEENYNVKGIEAYAGKWFDYSFFIRKYIESRVYEPDIKMMLEKTELSNVLEIIETDTDFSISYRSIVDGQIHYLQMRYVSVEGSDLVAVGFRYVDDVVKAEAEQKELLQQALASAQQANKAKTTFLNSMSHDIRTPMNAIVGFTALAQTHIDNTAQVRDYLSKISTSSTHLLSLINDILDMSRIDSGTVKLDEKPLHIPDLLHDLRTMIQSLVDSKNLNLYIDTQDIVHEDVITDKLRLNQILINIVGNAIKFTQPGGDIIVRLIEKPCRMKNRATYEFSVKDNGIGMSKEFVGHIFETFSREYSSTVSGVQGTGLGMAITKNIVDMMGGDITVESEEGKGSLFTVTLNLLLGDEPVQNEPIPKLLGARVLVVDDDLNTCRSVSKMLRDIQMRPDWTASGKEAVIRAQDAAEMGDEYKVYIIDYLMPDMNGIETVRRIRRIVSEEVPIIVLTAYDWADFEYEAREAGVTAFVSKPIFMSELRTVLTQPDICSRVKKDDKAVQYDYSGKHVLLVEDNDLNREIATAILEETGMHIDSANDGDVAVLMINEAPEDKYDLIFMDIQMPKMDGYTATREIRTLPNNKKANIPIVAMTANAFEEDKEKAFASGMNGHIIKPISIEQIAKVLDEIFEEEDKE